MKLPIKKRNQTTELKISSVNRGMDLEYSVDLTNTYYREINRAVIYKKPTPIQPVDVSYTKGHKLITEAYFKTRSTTDYNGIYRGMYVDFEAKETVNKNRFESKNIHEHQLNHLRKIKEHGGIGFFIICFRFYEEYYFLSIDDFDKYFLDNPTKKSIPYEYFKQHLKLIKVSYKPRLMYLDVIDELFF